MLNKDYDSEIKQVFFCKVYTICNTGTANYLTIEKYVSIISSLDIVPITRQVFLCFKNWHGKSNTLQLMHLKPHIK